MRAAEEVLSSEKGGSGRGVERGTPRSGSFGGGRDRAEVIRGRVARKPCASACPLEMTTLTGGAEATATQGAGEKRGDVAHCTPFDRDLTAEI